MWNLYEIAFLIHVLILSHWNFSCLAVLIFTMFVFYILELRFLHGVTHLSQSSSHPRLAVILLSWFFADLFKTILLIQLYMSIFIKKMLLIHLFVFCIISFINYFMFLSSEVCGTGRMERQAEKVSWDHGWYVQGDDHAASKQETENQLNQHLPLSL